MSLCQMNIEGFSIQDVSIIYIKIRLSSPLDFRGALHWTFEALSTELSRRSPLDFWGAFHWTFNFRCFDKDLCIKCFKNTKIQFEVTKKGQKQNRKKIDPLDFSGALHWTFKALSTGLLGLSPLSFRGALYWTCNFRCFDRDLCIKCFKNTKIQFEVTKRG